MISYKGYRYNDSWSPGTAHLCWKPMGEKIVMDIDSETQMTADLFARWVDLGLPTRHEFTGHHALTTEQIDILWDNGWGQQHNEGVIQ